MLILPKDKKEVKQEPKKTIEVVAEKPILTPQQIETAKHDKWAEEQFSSGVGGRAKLIIMVKKELNNSDSFEYVSTTRSFDKDDLIITMKYRAKNGFGAKILLEVRARVKYADDSVAIIE